MGRSADEPTSHELSSMSSNTRVSRAASDSQPRDIGKVVYRDGAKKPYRYKCDRKECSEVNDMARPGELMRHYFTKHEVELLECPYEGCSKRLARSDKLSEHYKKAHREYSEDVLGKPQATETYEDDDQILNEDYRTDSPGAWSGMQC